MLCVLFGLFYLLFFICVFCVHLFLITSEGDVSVVSAPLGAGNAALFLYGKVFSERETESLNVNI